MSNFKKLNTKKYFKTKAIVTPDTIYWKRLEAPTYIKEFGAIDFIDFSSIDPFYFAVTCSVRVQIYNPITKLVVKNLSRFQETAYGGTFRQDGRLLVAGDEQGFVKLFDTSSKNILRLFKGHKGPVHRVNFTSDLFRIVSFSDDKTVKLWDIGSEKAINTFCNHSDYIRAGTVNPVSPNILLSGGYDGKIYMYDTRTNETSITVDHCSPVESVLYLPTGGIFLSCGGTEIRVWDAFAGGRLVTKLTQHHKTVTCLRLASDGKRIISGGLDRHVKIYDVETYQTVHNLDFPNAVLSVGIAPNDNTVVAGMVDGLISVQNMEVKIKKDISSLRVIDRKQFKFTSLQVDHDIKFYENEKMAKYDELLRKYKYAKCLDKVMTEYICRNKPEVVVSIMQELIHRKGLHRALAGRSTNSLGRIIKFIGSNIGENRFIRPLIDVTMTLVDVYENNFHEFSDDLKKLFINFTETLLREIQLSYDLLELHGSLEILIDASRVSSMNEQDKYQNLFNEEGKTNLKPSHMAKESSILIV